MPNSVSRRDFTKTVGVSALSLALESGAKAEGVGTDALTHLSAKKLAGLIAAREVSAIEVATAYLKRIDEVNFDPDFRNKSLTRLQKFREDMMQFMASNHYNVLLSPVANNPAGPHPDPDASVETTALDAWESFKVDTGAFCMAHNLTGWPAAVVRAGGTTEGLPIGVQIAAKPWREDVAIAVAAVIEKRLGGWQPPVGL